MGKVSEQGSDLQLWHKMFLNMQIMDPHQIDWSRWWMRVIAISVLAWPLRILVEWLSHHFN